MFSKNDSGQSMNELLFYLALTSALFVIGFLFSGIKEIKKTSADYFMQQIFIERN